MLGGKSGDFRFVADNAKSMLHHDGAGFARAKLGFRIFEPKKGRVDIRINGSEAAGENRIYGGDTSIRGSNNFAGAESVANSRKDDLHAEASLEAEEPIFGIGAGGFGESLANFATTFYIIYIIIILREPKVAKA